MAVAVVAIAARILFLGERQLFRDEAASWLESSYPLPRLLEVAVGQPYPPLYTVVMHAWTSVAGDVEAALRGPSVIAGLVVVAVGWRWAHEALGRWPGLLAATVLALSPLAVANAREARMYALDAMFATIAWWLTWRLVAGRADGRRALGLQGIVLALAVAGELWTMAIGLFLGGLQGLVAVAALLQDSRRSEGRVAPTSGSAVAVVSILVGGLMFLPWLPAMLGVAANGEPYWTPVPSGLDWAASLGAALLGWRVGPAVAAVLLAFLLLLAAVGVVGLVTVREPARRRLAWCLLAGVTLPLLVWAISQVRSIYDTRYLGAVVPPLALAVAAGWESVARRFWRPTPAATLGLLVVLPMTWALGLWLADWRREEGLHPTRQLASALAPRLRPGDLVLALDARTYFPVAYAAHRSAQAGAPWPASVVDWDPGDEPFYRGGSLIPPEQVLEEREVRAAGGWGSLPGAGRGGRVWLVVDTRPQGPDLGFGPLARGELREVDRVDVSSSGRFAQARALVPAGD